MKPRTRRVIAWLFIAVLFTFTFGRQEQTNQRSQDVAAEARAVARKAQRAIDELEEQRRQDCYGTNDARELLRQLARDLVSDDGTVDARDQRTLDLVAIRLKPKDCT